ncbi:lysosomal acid lipase/cholesteryl ester hydrolase-like isoform X1 [Dermacentor silvarum]|uniref:lysosomal acid lipase/cholesteryl ester hydrolase-like isoform X1 n=1 Tax=Dermacentor silvarum TaxID=543639 RepID=UPI0021013C65|nr:lysosomal acid lipase/cholesteryl ester hydrolase-like isoform X1 [Dermacentor silvarum]
MKAFAAFGGKYHTLGTLVGLLTSLLWLHQLSVGNVDPDVERNVTEIIADKGYLVQEHTVTTRDGYVLPLQRIPYGRDELRSSSSSPTRRFQPRPPVIVMHALLFSSSVWVVNGPDQSLPYLLADAGFDVWLGNVRGNSQSRHVNYTWYQKEMWDFSLDEISEFDVADTIDFVLDVTGHNKTFFVGHSLGAATLFGLLSEKPDYNNKILLFSAMAPAIRLHNMTSPIPRILPILNELAAFAALFGRYDFLSHDRMTHFIVTTICRYPVTRAICPWIINVIAGQQTRPINATRMPVFLKDTPAGTSYKNMKHMGQVYTTRRFGKFDYGAQRNIEVYGKATPPEYDFRRVSAPVALFWSQADALVSAEHMATLREKLPNLVLDFRVADDRFSHQEFAIGVTAKEAVYDDLVDIMKRFSGQG